MIHPYIHIPAEDMAALSCFSVGHRYCERTTSPTWTIKTGMNEDDNLILCDASLVLADLGKIERRLEVHLSCERERRLIEG